MFHEISYTFHAPTTTTTTTTTTTYRLIVFSARVNT